MRERGFVPVRVLLRAVVLLACSAAALGSPLRVLQATGHMNLHSCLTVDNAEVSLRSTGQCATLKRMFHNKCTDGRIGDKCNFLCAFNDLDKKSGAGTCAASLKSGKTCAKDYCKTCPQPGQCDFECGFCASSELSESSAAHRRPSPAIPWNIPHGRARGNARKTPNTPPPLGWLFTRWVCVSSCRQVQGLRRRRGGEERHRRQRASHELHADPLVRRLPGAVPQMRGGQARLGQARHLEDVPVRLQPVDHGLQGIRPT